MTRHSYAESICRLGWFEKGSKESERYDDCGNDGIESGSVKGWENE
jgi:hypothetical protein